MLPLLRVVAAAAANVHSGATGGAHHHLQQALLRAAAVPAVRCGALPCPHTQVVQQHHAAALASSSAPWPSAGAVQQQHQRVQACSTLLQRLRGAAAALPLYACRQHHPAAASWVGANHQQQQQQQQWQQVRGLLGVVSVKNYQDHNQKRPGSKYKIKSPSIVRRRVLVGDDGVMWRMQAGRRHKRAKKGRKRLLSLKGMVPLHHADAAKLRKLGYKRSWWHGGLKA